MSSRRALLDDTNNGCVADYYHCDQKRFLEEITFFKKHTEELKYDNRSLKTVQAREMSWNMRGDDPCHYFHTLRQVLTELTQWGVTAGLSEPA